MRLHSLEVTAFGPFTDTVEVDFDTLSDAGLFLLTGATGAGKSSVLDAVCFALYGDVPGDRGTVKRLRSDQAPADRAPRVVLEATLGGRRFLIDRSPAWERPKKRGTGTTVQQASVAVSEWVGDGWTTRSTRLDEAGHLVTELVGMNLPQFCQVALLPQGRFQAFLRAKSEERHALLARVFRTGRFEAVERWLRERRTTTRRLSQTHQQVVADLLSRVSEAGGVDLPEEWQDLASAAESDLVVGWADDLLRAVRAEAGAAAAAAVEQGRRERAARTTLEQATVLAERQASHRDATERLAELTRAQPHHEAQVSRLDAGRRAATVAPLLRVVDDAVATHAAAAAAADRAVATAGGAGSHTGDPRGALAARSRSLVARCAEVAAALPRAAELSALERRLEESSAQAVRAAARIDRLRTDQDEHPRRLGTARTELAASTTAEAALLGASDRLHRLEARLVAAELVITLLPRRDDAAATHAAARSAAHDAREHWLEIREARLEGMASELAGRLAVGGCCPVCGSAEHPQPALALQGAPDATAEKAARRAVDDAESLLQAHEERLRELDTRLALARQQAGEGDPVSLAAEVEDARTTLRRLESEAAERPAREEAVRALEDARAALDADLREAADVARRAVSGRDEAAHLVTACRHEVDTLLADTCHTTLASLLSALEDQERDVAEALTALQAHDGAREALGRAREAAAAAAGDVGFSSAAAAAAAVLSAPALADLEREVADHRDRAVRLEALLTDPSLVEAADTPAPDLPALTEALHEAEVAATESDRAAALATRRHERLQGLRRETDEALSAWLPVRREHALAASMASLVEGTSADNRLQMRLSAYVLAHRLGQVVEAANERLAGMADQRYTLEHTARRGAGETRGGLSLLVRDDWSGESRDPATLSGGETFVVSLALALGLADVITREAGGADLDTLFVDEGFGSLDAETLDHVMDTLDSLRDGGRVVGVVSHVEEMRDRIPAQLRVVKGRGGSSLSVHAGGLG